MDDYACVTRRARGHGRTRARHPRAELGRAAMRAIVERRTASIGTGVGNDARASDDDVVHDDDGG